MLEASLRCLPEPAPSDVPRAYVPRQPAQTPPFYPQSPIGPFDNPAVFERLDTDTLFFIFYYQQVPPPPHTRIPGLSERRRAPTSSTWRPGSSRNRAGASTRST